MLSCKFILSTQSRYKPKNNITKKITYTQQKSSPDSSFHEKRSTKTCILLSVKQAKQNTQAKQKTKPQLLATLPVNLKTTSSELSININLYSITVAHKYNKQINHQHTRRCSFKKLKNCSSKITTNMSNNFQLKQKVTVFDLNLKFWLKAGAYLTKLKQLVPKMKAFHLRSRTQFCIEKLQANTTTRITESRKPNLTLPSVKRFT